jgi:hypothetical protein
MRQNCCIRFSIVVIRSQRLKLPLFQHRGIQFVQSSSLNSSRRAHCIVPRGALSLHGAIALCTQVHLSQYAGLLLLQSSLAVSHVSCNTTTL